MRVDAKEMTTRKADRKSSDALARPTLSAQPPSHQAFTNQALAIQSLALDLVRYGDLPRPASLMIDEQIANRFARRHLKTYVTVKCFHKTLPELLKMVNPSL